MTEETKVQLDRLLGTIREQFYAGQPPKKFFQDQNVLALAATWPATWLNHRGVTWTAERYFQTLHTLLREIKEHGATGEVKYFPGYLLKCIQDHFAHRSDEYCDEAKRTRSAFDLALGRAVDAGKLADIRTAEATVDVLAQAHRLLAKQPRRRKTPETNDGQLSLL